MILNAYLHISFCFAVTGFKVRKWMLQVENGACAPTSGPPVGEIDIFFPKQLTVGVLNATLDLAALVLVGVVGFLGSEVVLSPVVSHCLRLSPFM